jgi:hypothetical protein
LTQPLRELPTLPSLPKVCDPFFASLVVRAMVLRLLAYCGRHSAIFKWIKSQVVEKSAGFGELVVTSMDALLYGTYSFETGDFLTEKRNHGP